MFDRVTLVGLDSATASFALALRRNGYKGLIHGVTDSASVKRAKELGIINEGGDDLTAGVSKSDLIVLSHQSREMKHRLEKVCKAAQHGATILDASNIKSGVDETLSKHTNKDLKHIGFRIVGENGNDDWSKPSKFYFEDKTVILTPRGKSDMSSYGELHELFKAVGAQVICMSPRSLDKLTSEYTHLPRLLSMSLLDSIFSQNRGEELRPDILGTELIEDLQQLEAWSKSEWLTELDPIRDQVAKSLDLMIVSLQRIRKDVQRGKMKEHVQLVLDQAKQTVAEPNTETTPNLVVVAGTDPKSVERIAQLLADARLMISRLDRMSNAGDGTFKLSMNSLPDRDKAVSLLQEAGIEAFQLP